MMGHPHLTLTTGSMNRLEPLRRALPTWLALTEVDEIFVVDWGSDEPLREALRDFKDPRIQIVRVTDQRHWQNSKCHNLEIFLAGFSDLLLRFDNDTLVLPDFLAKHPPKRLGFYAVNWRTVPREVDDKRNLAGTLYIPLQFIRRVNGYNERLVHYGREDDDLHARLTIEGYAWQDVDLNTVDHIPHSDEARFKNLAIGTSVLQRAKVSEAQDKIWGTNTSPRTTLISMSEQTLAEKPWTKHDKRTDWEVKQVGDRYWECNERKSNKATGEAKS
jgi:glycosyltransferase involved in cell wall biosynthesis